jgi:hypothetical protein
MLNLMSFKNVGIDTIQASRAFKQIRASARIYTTNLVTTPSYLTNKYTKLNHLYFNDSDLINTNNFGIKHQFNLTSAAANTSVNATFLDATSMRKFLTYNLQHNLNQNQTHLHNNAVDLYSKHNTNKLNSLGLNLFNVALSNSNKYNSSTLKLLTSYPNVVKTFGDNSDVKATNYPLRQLFKKSFTKSVPTKLINKKQTFNAFNIKDSVSKSTNYFNTQFKNPSKSSKEFMINYSYRSQPFGKQSVRKYKNLNAHTTNYNLSLGLNSVDSNLTKFNTTGNYTSLLTTYQLKKAN